MVNWFELENFSPGDPRWEQFRFLARIVTSKILKGHKNYVDDVVNDVMTKVVLRQGQCKSRGIGGVRAWVFSVAKYEALGCLRKLIKLREVSIEDIPPTLLVETKLPNMTLRVYSRELFGEIDFCLANMSPTRREIFSLRYLHDLSVEDVAKRLQRPPGSVKSESFRARTEIRKHLERKGFRPAMTSAQAKS